jgi:hypothetical protein
MAVKQSAITTALWIGDGGSPETFFMVPSVGDVAGPKKSVTTIDVTTQDSPEGYDEFIYSLKSGGTVAFPLEFDPNAIEHNGTATVAGVNAGGLDYLLENRVKRNMRVALPTSPAMRFGFLGLVTGLDGDFKVKGSVKASVMIKISGPPTLEAGVGGPS